MSYGQKKQSRKVQVQTEDEAFEHALRRYVDLVLEQEREVFHSEIESFASHSAKVRNRLMNSFRDFRESFLRGYHVLAQELKKRKNS